MPDWVKNEPAVLPTDRFYLSAYWLLATKRPPGEPANYIPWDTIWDYAQKSGLDEVNTKLLKATLS